MSVVRHSIIGDRGRILGSLELNAVPLALWSDAADYKTRYSIPVNRWLKPGENTVRVTVAPATPADHVRHKFSVEIERMTDSQYEIDTLVEFNPFSSLLSGPKSLDLKFRVDHPPATRMWSELQRLVSAESTRTEALSFTAHVLETLRAGSVEEGIAVRRYSSEEQARCEGIPAHAVPGMLRASVEEFADRTDWVLVPVDLTRARASLVGDGHLVWIRPPASDRAVVYRDREGFELGYDLYLGKIGGRWTWVR